MIARPFPGRRARRGEVARAAPGSLRSVAYRRGAGASDPLGMGGAPCYWPSAPSRRCPGAAMCSIDRVCLDRLSLHRGRRRQPGNRVIDLASYSAAAAARDTAVAAARAWRGSRSAATARRRTGAEARPRPAPSRRRPLATGVERTRFLPDRPSTPSGNPWGGVAVGLGAAGTWSSEPHSSFADLYEIRASEYEFEFSQGPGVGGPRRAALPHRQHRSSPPAPAPFRVLVCHPRRKTPESARW